MRGGWEKYDVLKKAARSQVMLDIVAIFFFGALKLKQESGFVI